MTRKTNEEKEKPSREKFPRKAFDLNSKANPQSVEELFRAYANLITSPEFSATRIIQMMHPQNLRDDIDIPTLMAALRDSAATAQADDFSQAEAMLMNQAIALQALFVRLTERAMEQPKIQNLEAFLKMGLRSQSQCRTTLETLVNIRNPPVVYAKQANVTTGPQQINNGVKDLARAPKRLSEQNQLSGGNQVELPKDTRTSYQACRDDSAMEALGEIDRPKDRSRQV